MAVKPIITKMQSINKIPRIDYVFIIKNRSADEKDPFIHKYKIHAQLYEKKDLCDLCPFVLMDRSLPFFWNPVGRFWNLISHLKAIHERNNFH